MVRALLFAIIGAALWAAPARAACDAVLPGPVVAGAERDITARDLIEMRDIGAPDGANAYGLPPLAISPDGRSLTFVIRRADLATNSYCHALVVLELAHHASPRIVDRGGERIAETFTLRGAVVSDGWPRDNMPEWSPDGQSIGYLKRVAGVTQVWVAAADGSGATDRSRSATDVDQWTWLPDGRLIYSTDPGMVAARQAIDVEGEHGWLYDDRMWLGMSSRPLPVADRAPVVYVVDRAGVRRLANNAERQRLGTALSLGGNDVAPIMNGAGWKARTANVAPSPASPQRIEVVSPGGKTIVCTASACNDGAVRLWWLGRSLLFLRREGWSHENMALYRWAPGSATAHRIFSTANVLIGCVFRTRLFCTSESSAIPRTIVAIDVRSGKTETLFEPNPEFRRIRLGSVHRLHTRNRFGLTAWGDLVLPPAYRPGDRLPLIVVQYRSRGFLRGGTGDEYPIFLMAARGFAVLSTDAPANVATLHPELTSFDQLNAVGLKDWTERKNVFSSLDAAIDAAVATGSIDSGRIGITGLSDGSATVQYALLNSNRFAAAAMSTCCLEPTMVMTQGPAWADFNRETMGFPSLTRPDPAFWAAMSFRQNAARLDVPILIQEADREYPQALEAYMALREQRKPVEMYIYPDEYHTRVQPLHRLATYLRTIDWFDFWLRGHEDPDPSKLAQYQRWRALRRAWQH